MTCLVFIVGRHIVGVAPNFDVCIFGLTKRESSVHGKRDGDDCGGGASLLFFGGIVGAQFCICKPHAGALLVKLAIDVAVPDDHELFE